MYLTSAFVGQGVSFSPSASGAPTEWTQGTNSPSAPSASRAACPIRVMIRIETTTYGESVSWTPTCDLSDPSGPMENGTTYIVRPLIDPPKSSAIVSRISAGAPPLLFGPASSCVSPQKKDRCP